jgi:PIN domain nuclease of toxin-antitoxin system
VASITWYELARLAEKRRISTPMPLRAWLDALASNIETIAITPAIAVTAASLPGSFGGDPADRIIYATAIELGCQLVTKDRKMRAHRTPNRITIW